MAKERARILKIITTPLIFVGLVALGIEAIVLAVVFNKEALSQSATAWVVFVGIAVLVAIVAAVLIFAWHKPKNLTYDRNGYLLEGAYGTETEQIRPEHRFEGPRGRRFDGD